MRRVGGRLGQRETKKSVKVKMEVVKTTFGEARSSGVVWASDGGDHSGPCVGESNRSFSEDGRWSLFA